MRTWRQLALLCGATAVALLVVLASLRLAVASQTSSTDQLAVSSLSVSSSSQVFGADGSLVARLHGPIDREPVSLDAIGEHLRKAVIAIEDRRFYGHGGLDPRGIARAVLSNVRSENGLQGGSTISQQLAKNVYLHGEPRTLWRKAVEALLTLGMERGATKDEILEAYLNTVHFGRGVYGVQAAATSFFQKDVSELTLSESAFLAGLIHMPARYDWAVTDDPELQDSRKSRALQRRDTVLRAMVEVGALTAHEARAAADSPLEIHPPAESRWNHPYFIDAVLRELGVLRSGGQKLDERFDRLGTTYAERAEAVYGNGLRIYTTLDPGAQVRAENALTQVLPPGNLSKLSAALVTVEPGTGYVRTLIGGRNYYPEGCDDPAAADPPSACRYAKVNLALGAVAGGSGRQPGSAFKPFVLAAALEDGVSLRQRLDGSPFKHSYQGGEWDVRNYEGSAGGHMDLVDATARSVNAAYARLQIRHLGDGDAIAGSRKVAAVSRKLGINFPTPAQLRESCGDDFNQTGACTPADYVPAIALGAKEVSPLGMAAAYAAFAGEGVYAKPTTITRITDASGEVLYEAEPERRRAISRATALGVTHALQEVVRRGTGRAAALGRPVAGKTGTSQEWRDAWFAGYVPQVTTVVWVGNPVLVQTASGRWVVESMTPSGGYGRRIVGGSYPAQIWGAFMRQAVQGLPVEDFPEAPNELFKTPEPVPEEREELEDAPGVVPGVVGMSRGAARSALGRAGYSVSVLVECPPGGGSQRGMSVWRQSPGPGADVPRGASVTIWTSRAVCR